MSFAHRRHRERGALAAHFALLIARVCTIAYLTGFMRFQMK
jgi:hypothetical protein